MQMAELSERLGLDTNALLDEYQDTQQVLFPVTTVRTHDLPCSAFLCFASLMLFLIIPL